MREAVNNSLDPSCYQLSPDGLKTANRRITSFFDSQKRDHTKLINKNAEKINADKEKANRAGRLDAVSNLKDNQ
jgi:hypothetical protein